jgi:uroporphyrinogen-III synthase
MIYILSEKIYEGASNLPSIMIEYKERDLNLNGYDALVFSSKNGVEAIDKITKKWREIPAFSIGTGTSKAIEALGGKLTYSARSSYGDNFANEIKRELAGKRVLFLRAKVVTSSLNTILKEAGVLLDEEVVYETKCTPCERLKTPSKGSVIIFSSPSTIACFFHCFSWDESYQAVVIGEKTASFMPKEISFIQSPKQTIPSCIEVAKRLSKKAL